MTLATLNTIFHIDLGRFVGDQTCINNILKSNNPLQQHGAILRSEYHRKQQRKKFPKARCCKP
jgi:hypothetical protein